MEMTRRKQWAVRRFVRRKLGLFHPVLRDEELFNLFVTDELFSATVTINDATTQGLQDFLDWLINNQDAIFKLIQRLIDLFSGFSVETAVE